MAHLVNSRTRNSVKSAHVVFENEGRLLNMAGETCNTSTLERITCSAIEEEQMVNQGQMRRKQQKERKSDGRSSRSRNIWTVGSGDGVDSSNDHGGASLDMARGQFSRFLMAKISLASAYSYGVRGSFLHDEDSC